MAWEIVERRLGRAGGEKERLARQRRWDRRFGEGLWDIGYLVEGRFISQHEAFESIYVASYEAHFEDHPEDLEELCSRAKALRNPHAAATTGVDLQVPALHEVLARRGRTLAGDEVVDIGSWQGSASHALSVRLSPLQIRCVAEDKRTLESFWQRRKCLAVWRDEEVRGRDTRRSDEEP